MVYVGLKILSCTNKSCVLTLTEAEFSSVQGCITGKPITQC